MGETTPNFDRIIFLMNSNVRAIECSYEPDNDAANIKGRRVVFKSMDKTIRPGMFVVVPSKDRWNLTIVKVTEVDVEPDIESAAKMEWIIGTFDPSQHEKTAQAEAEVIAAVKQQQRARRTEQLRKDLIGGLSPELQRLTMVNNLDGPAIEPPQRFLEDDDSDDDSDDAI